MKISIFIKKKIYYIIIKMPKKVLSEATVRRLKKHGEVHGKAHMNKMKRLMEEPPHHSFKKAHDMAMKPQTTKDRLDEAEGKKKGMKKKKQTKQDRLDEAEGKKRGMAKTKGQMKRY